MAADTISFARGAPSLDIVDIAGLQSAAKRAFQSDPAAIIGYGASVGHLPLRRWIAERHGVPVEQVMVTNGSLQADAFLFDALVQPGTPVVVEKPTYDRTLLGLRNRGAQLYAVTVEADGLDTRELAELLESGLRPAFAHVIPNFQNPSGATLSLDKRQHLLELARRYDFLIFEDDPYLEIRFKGQPLPTMLSMDDTEHVVYASSFSKTICPGIRVGYLIGPAELVARLAKTATSTYITPNLIAQAMVYEFCASGDIERSIKTVRAALAERAQRLGDRLAAELPEARFVRPDGGYFLWVELPGVDAGELFTAAAARGVAVVRGTDFVLDGGTHALRLAYSAVCVEDIDEGVRRLAEAVRAAMVSRSRT